MNKRFRQQYRYSRQIQNQLSDYWGYSITSPTLEIKHKNIAQSIRPVVANITLRKFQKDVPKTQKIRQIQSQIRELENERMLRQLKEGKSAQPTLEQKSDIINLMQKLIQDYNDILQHKHIQNGKGQKQSRPMSQQKNKNLVQIEMKKSLLKNADLSQQIQINKEIAALYRGCNEVDNNLSSISLKNNRSIIPEPPSPTKIMKKHQSQTFQDIQQFALDKSINKFQSLKMSNSDKKFRQITNRKNIDRDTQAEMIRKFKQLQLKKNNIINKRTNKKCQVSKNNTKTIKNNAEYDIRSPYLGRKELLEYRQMQNKIKNDNQALDLWKNKIIIASRKTRLKQNSSRERETYNSKHVQSREQQIQHALQKSINFIDFQQSTSKQLATNQTERLQKMQQQQIFAGILRKRNNKFSRQCGTKILIKYNSQQKARLMLKGQSDSSQERKTKSSSSQRKDINSQRYKSKTLDLSKQLQLYSSQESNRMIWVQENDDQQHYERMCRNEKINLFLKKRR